MNEGFPYQDENGISTASTTNLSTQIQTNLEPLKTHTINDSLQPSSRERQKNVVDQYEQVTEIDETIENDKRGDTRIQAGINELLGSEGFHFPLNNNLPDGQQEEDQEEYEEDEEIKVEQQEESYPCKLYHSISIITLFKLESFSKNRS
mmetsp:Transcript_56911/g.65209  ORF Transcript_56911/g.65209 Transcript_56911/m.65209 type:complete len:149 (-) Transcript_56911:1369-1815(-)